MSKSRPTKHEMSRRHTAGVSYQRNERELKRKLDDQIPGVESVDFTLRIENASNETHFSGAKGLPATISCGNSDCTEGGFELLGQSRRDFAATRRDVRGRPRLQRKRGTENPCPEIL